MAPKRSGWILACALLTAVAVFVCWGWLRRNAPLAAGGGHAGAITLGSRAYSAGDWPRAENLARGVLRGDASNVEALRLVARSAARQGRHESAETIYRRLGTARMQAEDLFLLGKGLLERGSSGPALAALRSARAADADHAETLDALSRYWAKAGSMTDAVATAERLGRQPGWELNAAVRLARLRAELFDPGPAAELLAGAFARDPALVGAELDRAAAERLLARCWLRAGQPDRAVSVLAPLVAAGSDPAAAWLLSRAYLQKGNAAEAIRASGQVAPFADGSDPMNPEPAPYVGAASCRSCHPAEYRKQQSSPHALTLRPTAELRDLPWPDHPIADDANPAANHQFRRVDDRVLVETQVGDARLRAVVEYALGSNHQGQSFLARDSRGRVRELRISRYPASPEWFRTMEHPAIVGELAGYLGRPISDDAARQCLHCHATNFQAARHPENRPEARDRGIGCERCHGPGGNHVQAIATHYPEPAINRPRLASAAQVVELCGQCHKAPATVALDEPRAVRFQEPSLVASRCYTESRGELSCVTCHDPHQKAERSPAHYEAKCLACHLPAVVTTTHRDPPSQASRSVCSVNPRSDCLACHMPRISGAVPRAVFTDHRIRIRRDDGKPKESAGRARSS